MQSKSKLILSLITIFLCLTILSQTVSAYTYPRPRERINDLGELHWLFYAISFIAIVLGALSFMMKGKSFSIVFVLYFFI